MRVLRQDPTLCRRMGRSTNPQRQQLSKIKTSTSSWLRHWRIKLQLQHATGTGVYSDPASLALGIYCRHRYRIGIHQRCYETESTCMEPYTLPPCPQNEEGIQIHQRRHYDDISTMCGKGAPAGSYAKVDMLAAGSFLQSTTSKPRKPIVDLRMSYESN